MEPETSQILENIRTKRNEKKITVFDLSCDAGISHSHLFYIESKRVVPSVDVLVRIAKALGVEIGELLDNDTGKPKR
jgi:transcriptional regulator with XRE-family HTH domain